MKKLGLYLKYWNLLLLRHMLYVEHIVKNPGYKPGEIAYRLINIACIKTKRKIKGEQVYDFPKYNKFQKYGL